MDPVIEKVFKFYDPSLAYARSPIVIDQPREMLPALFHSLGYRIGAEIGVECGIYSEIIYNSMPGVKLYAVDAWQAYPGYRDHVTQAKIDSIYQQAAERLKGKAHLVRKYSIAAAQDFDDGILDFVYIDGNHDFLHVTEDIHYWSAKVRKGGIIAGHDFKRHKGSYINHVKDVVQAWTYSHGIDPWFVLAGDKSPSWFWVKQ